MVVRVYGWHGCIGGGRGTVAIVLTDVRVSFEGPWGVVAPIGELDLASMPRLRAGVVSVVAGGCPNVVLDLGAVDFVDSAGLGAVVAAVKRVRAAGGVLRVVRPEPRVWAVFELVDLDRVLDSHPDLAAATATAPPVDAGADDG